MSHTLENQPERPSPGELRVARLRGALSRLVLVVASNPEEPASLVSLATNELEFATGADVRLEPAETGLGYPVLIETDLVAPVWDSQLGPLLGRIVPELGEVVAAVPHIERIDDDRRGLPLAGPWDARWRWKRSELSDLHELASDRMASIAGADEEATEGTEELAAMPVAAVAEGVGVSVDFFDPGRPPLIRWHRDDNDAAAVARLLRDLRPDLAWALRQLAIAETRLRTHDVPLWQIDRAVAALALEAHVPDEDGAVLGEYIAVGADALLSIAGVLGELDADAVRWCLDELEPLRVRMSPQGQAVLAEVRQWAHDRQVFEEWPSVALERRSADNSVRLAPVAPELVIRGLVDAGAPGLLTESGTPEAATASVWLSERASVAVRAWRAAMRLSIDDVERRRAEALLEATTGSRGAAIAWLQLFDRTTGAAIDAIPFDSVDYVGGGRTRVELSARVPSELLAATSDVGILIVARPDCAVDRESLLSRVLVVLPAASEAAAAFAAAIAHEIRDEETARTLRRVHATARPANETVGERLLIELMRAQNQWINHLGDRLATAETAEEPRRATTLTLQEAEPVMQSLRRIRRLLP